jgi:hypothetical protein
MARRLFHPGLRRNEPHTPAAPVIGGRSGRSRFRAIAKGVGRPIARRTSADIRKRGCDPSNHNERERADLAHKTLARGHGDGGLSRGNVGTRHRRPRSRSRAARPALLFHAPKFALLS